jgi:hypothetical protein
MAVLPGIDGKSGPVEIMHAVKDLNSGEGEENVYDLYNRVLNEGLIPGRAPAIEDRIRAIGAVQMAFPRDKSILADQMTKAMIATSTFDQGMTQGTQLLREFERQSGMNVAEVSMERILSPQSGVAAGYRLFLLGAFRKATVGQGNPSNFEQELLLNLIADPKGLFQITSNSIARTRTLLLITTNSYLRDLREQGMKPSAKTLETLTKKFRNAGLLDAKHSISEAMIKDFDTALNAGAATPMEQLRGLQNWADIHNITGGVSQLLGNESTAKNWVRVGRNSSEETAARKKLESTIAPDGISEEERARNLGAVNSYFSTQR